MEKSVLDDMMSREGWEMTSGFIKYKVFGIDPEYKLLRQIETRDPSSIAIILRDHVLELVNKYEYFLFRYNKDMNQLYREEGVDTDKWIAKTNRWHSSLVKETQDMLILLRTIAKELGLKEYFELPSEEMKIDIENASQEELEALAAQIHKEEIMMGRE